MKNLVEEFPGVTFIDAPSVKLDKMRTNMYLKFMFFKFSNARKLHSVVSGHFIAHYVNSSIKKALT